jgi:hypothetical protein
MSPLLTLETLGHRIRIVFVHEDGLTSMEEYLSVKVVKIYGVRRVLKNIGLLNRLLKCGIKNTH